jgi:hypothetical protein
MEHIENPEGFFSELMRVMKKGGYFCIRTLNSFSYFGLASRLIPNRLHSKVLSQVQSTRKECDVFPTYYRFNNLWKIRSVLDSFHIEYVAKVYEAEPAYLSFSHLAYFLG